MDQCLYGYWESWYIMFQHKKTSCTKELSENLFYIMPCPVVAEACEEDSGLLPQKATHQQGWLV